LKKTGREGCPNMGGGEKKGAEEGGKLAGGNGARPFDSTNHMRTEVGPLKEGYWD